LKAAEQLLTRCIARLNTSNKHGKAKQLAREGLLRMRGVLLTYDPRMKSSQWSALRRLLIYLDPVAAGLWPRLRQLEGLNLPQRIARWLVIRQNPQARDAISLEDVRNIHRRWLDEQRRSAPKIPLSPRVKSKLHSEFNNAQIERA
jgi:hypothetical protein